MSMHVGGSMHMFSSLTASASIPARQNEYACWWFNAYVLKLDSKCLYKCLYTFKEKLVVVHTGVNIFYGTNNVRASACWDVVVRVCLVTVNDCGSPIKSNLPPVFLSVVIED